ncbi:MAG: replication initiation protein RepC [Hyphomicrobiales bacterium]|nr:replication initiation protein RepC [Hyphomicrobiales bacterium]
MGAIHAPVALATLLQRSGHAPEARIGPGKVAGPVTVTVNGSPAITSPGTYLRALTDKPMAGEFALGPVLMALIGQRLKAKRAVPGSFAD